MIKAVVKTISYEHLDYKGVSYMVLLIRWHLQKHQLINEYLNLLLTGGIRDGLKRRRLGLEIVCFGGRIQFVWFI